MQEGITIAQWKKDYQVKCQKNRLSVSNYGGYSYDAVWTLAYALDKLFKANQSHAADLHTQYTTE